MNLTEKTLKKEYQYQGKILKMRVDEVELPNGNTATREVVEHPGGVTIAALTDNDELLFVRQFRYPYETVLLELPAGKLEMCIRDSYHVDKYGDVASVKAVNLDEDIIMISSDGIIIRIEASSIRECARPS